MKSTKNITLQHDAHNQLDRLDNQLYQLDKWNRENYGPYLKEGNKPPDMSKPYVVAEYMRTHIKEMRSIINEYYKLTKELETE